MLSTFAPRTRAGRPEDADRLRRRVRRPRQPDQRRRSASCGRSLSTWPGDAQPVEPEERAAQPRPGAGRRGGRGGAGGRGAGAAVRRPRRHVRGDQPRPARRSRRRSRRRRRRWPRRPRRSACRRRSWRGSRTSRAASGPGAAELRRALPLINGALSAGIPPSSRTPELGDGWPSCSTRSATLSENPNTLLSLRDLRRALQVSRPALQQIAPYQTVCNYLVYFFNPLGTHLSETVPGGTQERIKAKLDRPHAGEHARPDRVPAAGGRAHRPGPAVRRRSRRCTRSTAARRSTSRAAPTARAGRPATRTGS